MNTRKRVLVLAISLFVLLALNGCQTKNNDDSSKIDDLYIIDYFSGYKFFNDGTVIFYEVDWFRTSDEPVEPEYWYGTYTLEGTSLTITLSGIEKTITGVYTDKRVVIDGEVCEIKHDAYYEEGMHESWKKLDKELGLS